MLGVLRRTGEFPRLPKWHTHKVSLWPMETVIPYRSKSQSLSPSPQSHPSSLSHLPCVMAFHECIIVKLTPVISCCVTGHILDSLLWLSFRLQQSQGFNSEFGCPPHSPKWVTLSRVLSLGSVKIQNAARLFLHPWRCCTPPCVVWCLRSSVPAFGISFL